MRIETERFDDTLLARVEGELDMTTAGSFREEIDRELDTDGGVRNLVLSLSGLSFVDSSGLGAILGRYRRIRERGGRMVTAGAPAHITKLMSLSGLQRIILTYDCEAEALRNCRG